MLQTKYSSPIYKKKKLQQIKFHSVSSVVNIVYFTLENPLGLRLKCGQAHLYSLWFDQGGTIQHTTGGGGRYIYIYMYIYIYVHTYVYSGSSELQRSALLQMNILYWLNILQSAACVSTCLNGIPSISAHCKIPVFPAIFRLICSLQNGKGIKTDSLLNNCKKRACHF